MNSLIEPDVSSGRYRLPKQHIFPVVALIALLVLTVTEISGSSVGLISSAANLHASNLFGNSEPIRSDEWNVTSPLIVGSYNAGMPTSLRGGFGVHSLSLLLDLPNRGWIEVLKPFNWGFFFLPLKMAFAFRWWTILLLLLIPAYYFAYAMTNRIRLSVALSLLLTLSPFFFWWYEEAALDTVGLGLLAMLCLRTIIKAPKNDLQSSVAVVGVAYSISAMVLLLYPPFLIPTVIIIAIFSLILITTSTINSENRIYFLKRLSVQLSLLVTLTIMIGIAFYLSNKNAISAITHTVYPGNRVSTAGTAPIQFLFSYFASYAISQNTASIQNFTNASEISGFLLIAPFVIGLMKLRIKSLKDSDALNFVLFAIATIFFLAWMFINLPKSIGSVSLMQFVPAQRAIVGVGLAAWFTLVSGYALICDNGDISLGKSDKLDFWSKAAISISLFSFYALLSVSQMNGISPALNAHHVLPLLFALSTLTGFILLVRKQNQTIAVVLTAFGLLFPVFHINPLIRGIGDLGSSRIRNAIYHYAGITDSKNPNSGPAWATVGTPAVKDILTASGVDVLNSVSFYPDSSFFNKIGMKSYKSQWDRYANIIITPSTTTNSIVAVQGDLVNYSVNFCSSEFKLTGVKFLAASSQITGFSCLDRSKVIQASAGSLYLYTIK